MDELSFIEVEPKMAKGFWDLAIMTAFAALTLSIWAVLGFVRSGTVELVDLADWLEIVVPALLWVSAVSWVLPWAHWRRNRDKFRYRLSADRNGLTYANERASWHWPWSSLSPFEHVAAGWFCGECVRFHPRPLVSKDHQNRPGPGSSAAARLRISLRGWEMYLLDSFGRPLAEIAAELNEYRGRALGKAGPDAALDRPPT